MNNNITNCKCEQCGKEFYKHPSEINKNTFCNQKCYWEWLGRDVEPNKNNCICPVCEKEFYRKPSYLKKLKRKPTCGIECKGKLQTAIKYEKMCNLVNEDFEEYLRREYLENKKNIREISIEVYGKISKTLINDWMKSLGVPRRSRSESVALQWVDNDERKKEAVEIMLEVRQRPEVIRKLNEHRKSKEFREVISKANSGKNNGMWNPEITDEERLYRNKRGRKIPGYGTFRKLVYERDNYTCQVCKDNTGGNLVAHHLNGFHWDKESRTEVDNGITLCNECHNEFHAIYGSEHNNLFQFSQYLVTKQTI